MTVVNIHSIEMVPLTSARLSNAMIDLPAAGTEQTSYSIRIEGWVLTRNLPSVEVVIFHKGLSLLRSKTIVERPDVREYFRDIPDAFGVGFYVQVDTLLFPEDFEITVMIAFEDESEERIGIIRGHRRPLLPPFAPTLQPLAIYGMGRSGTTLLMRYLTHHPQVITYDQYPYELRMMSYLFQAFGVLGSRADYTMSAHPDEFIADINWLGFNPYHDPTLYSETVIKWLNNQYVNELAAFSMRSLDSFYQTIAHAQQKSTPLYFAEKTEAYGRNQYQWLLYPQSRALILARDFRDRHCSVQAYNAKRGFVTFGLEISDSDETFVRKTAYSFAFTWANLQEHPDQILLVRYEDMILQPHETLLKITRYLGLDESPSTIAQMIAATHTETPWLREHRTTPDAIQSIGRWKRDLDPKLVDLYETYFGEFLKELGYET